MEVTKTQKESLHNASNLRDLFLRCLLLCRGASRRISCSGVRLRKEMQSLPKLPSALQRHQGWCAKGAVPAPVGTALMYSYVSVGAYGHARSKRSTKYRNLVKTKRRNNKSSRNESPTDSNHMGLSLLYLLFDRVVAAMTPLQRCQQRYSTGVYCNNLSMHSRKALI